MAADGTAPARGPLSAPAGERLPVLAFIGDEESETIFRAALASRAPLLPVRRGTVRTAIAALEREPTPRVLVVDLSGEGDPVVALDRLAAVCEPDVQVLAIGDQTDIAFYRTIRQDYGVSDYMARPLTRDNVARIFGPYITGRPAEDDMRGGRVVAVCGVRGGAGATTLAVNLAAQVAATTRSYVALLDLHLRGGTAALLLGVPPTAGLRVALEDPERVDTLFVERVAAPIGDRLRLLSTDEPPGDIPAARPDGAVRLIEMLRAKANVVIVDLPWPPGPVEQAVLATARQRVLVFTPDLAGVRNLVAARAMLTAQGDRAGPVLVVLNRAGQPGGLDPRMIAQSLGATPDIVIPWLPKPIQKAATLGRPAMRDSAALRRALAPLALEVSGQRPDAPRGLLARLFGRRT